MNGVVKQYQASIKMPFAHLGFVFNNEKLVGIDFIEADTEIKATSEAADTFVRQVKQYCNTASSNFTFDLPLSATGTPFQMKVWNELRKIPLGQVVTYGQLARKLNTSARAVGNACRNNPIPVVIPCHRVVAANGVGGYAGHTDGSIHQVKHWLLKHENVSLT